MQERLFLQLEGDSPRAPEVGAPAGAMREHAVLPALREHVASVLTYREAFAPGARMRERVLPDGAVRIMVHASGAPHGAGAGPGADVAGATAAPVLLELQGTIAGVSIALRPGAVSDVLGVPAAELRGMRVALAELWPEGGELVERVVAAQGDAERARLLQYALLDRVRFDAATERRRMLTAVGAIAAGSVRGSLAEAADAIGVSERRLQQLFRRHVGLTPRVFRRLSRLRACLRELRGRRQPRWPELSVDCGFYDQAHLIGEFRAFVGLTPGQYAARVIAGSSNTGR